MVYKFCLSCNFFVFPFLEEQIFPNRNLPSHLRYAASLNGGRGGKPRLAASVASCKRSYPR